MPRLTSQNNEIKEERKKSIIASSYNVFALYEQKDATVDLICKEAKISHGLFYHYFKDIDDLYSQIINSPKINNTKEKLINKNEAIKAIERIEQFINTIEDIILENINDLPVMLLLINEIGKNTISAYFSSLVRQGQIEGDVIGGNSEEITEIFLSIFKARGFEYLINNKRNSPMPDRYIVLELIKKRGRP